MAKWRIKPAPATLLVLSMCGGLAHAQPIMPVDQIRPGMVGYGLTVFQGFQVERFKAEVIAVLKNFLPKQDIILMKVDHPKLRQAKVVGGMSGSPIYINGKLVGALAYGWRFSKEPIAGITPISSMLGMLKRKLRGPPSSARIRTVSQRDRRRVENLAQASLSRRDRWWRAAYGPRRPTASEQQTMLQPVSVPLSVAGLSRDVFVDVRRMLGRYNFEPVQGGGTGKAEGPTRFVQGGAIGMQLARGDVSMSGTGTVTWVNGKDVLAFGHSAFNAGEIYLPAISARIDHTLANLARSFKLSSPARVLGMLVQDRQPAIHVDTSRRVGMIPMQVRINAGSGKQIYRVQIARHRLLTASLASSVVSSALSEALADIDYATYRMQTRITLRNLPQLKLTDHGYSFAGVRRAAVFGSRGLNAVSQLLDNQFEPIEIDRIDIGLDVKLGSHGVTITALRVGSNVVEAGSRINISVTYRPYHGSEFTKSYPLEIPRSLAGSMVVAEVASGEYVTPELATPRNLRQYLHNIQQGYPGRAVVLSLYTPTTGIKMNGQVVRDLPDSVLDSLNTGSQVAAEQTFKAYSRKVIRTQTVIAGKKQIRIRVKASEVEE